MKIIGTEKFSSLMSIACLTITSIVFGSLFATPQLLFAQGEANETFFEAAVREAGQTEQQNQTEAAAPPSPQPSSTEQQNQTEAAAPPSPQPSSTEQQNQTQSQNPFEQLGQAISKLFGGN
ncbi:MAG: hypothetical protein WCF46_06700, partial [Nitrososphaeraceae archaeon]|jgi:hypothetical protein